MKIDVLIVTPFYPPNIGGAETFTEQLAKEVSKWKNVIVLTFMPFCKEARKYQETYSRNGSLKIFRMKWLIKPLNVWKGTGLRNVFTVFPSIFFGSLFHVITKKPRIVHSKGLISGMAICFLKKIFRFKHYNTLLALYDIEKRSWLFRKLFDYVLDSCDLIFVEGLGGDREVSFSKIRKNVVIFNHWVDQEMFKPGDRKNDKIRVLFVGRPIREKGRHIIEEAERILNNPKYEFIYVEDLKNEDLAKMYQMAHICCVPSLYSEGFSRVVAEAASCGCVLITSNKGSLPEQVQDFGYFIEPTGEKFAHQIEKANIYEMSYRAYTYARENFSNKNVEVFLNAYS